MPTSAALGDGIGNLMAHIVDQCQTRYIEKLAFSEELDCIVMEVFFNFNKIIVMPFKVFFLFSLKFLPQRH